LGLFLFFVGCPLSTYCYRTGKPIYLVPFSIHTFNPFLLWKKKSQLSVLQQHRHSAALFFDFPGPLSYFPKRKGGKDPPFFFLPEYQLSFLFFFFPPLILNSVFPSVIFFFLWNTRHLVNSFLFVCDIYTLPRPPLPKVSFYCFLRENSFFGC